MFKPLCLISLGLATFSFCASAFSAGGKKPWHPQEFPIGYWYGPPTEFNKIETWKTVAEANFTFAAPCGSSVENNRKFLRFCEEVGLKALVRDKRVSPDMVYNDDWKQTIAAVVRDYRDFPALYGYFITDEPNYEIFQALGQIHAEFQKLDPKHLPYINLFPTYASVHQLGTPTYSDYLDKFLSIVKPAVLSYDHYCLLKTGQIRPDYFENLKLVCEYAQRYDVPPWNIILSLPHLGYRDPTAAEMRWQVYTSLVYGIKGILYFTYWTHPSWAKEGKYAIVGPNGEPRRLYPVVKQLNAEMKHLGKVLLRLKSTGVYHTGEIPWGCTRQHADLPIQVPDDKPLITGFFKAPNGASYVMIVNRDFKEPCDIEVRVKSHVVKIAEIRRTDTTEKTIPIKDGKIAFRLGPGDGRLFRYETRFEYPEPPRVVHEIDFDFGKNVEGWGAFSSMSSPTIVDGVLRSRITGNDPHFARQALRIAPDRYSKIVVRMKMPKAKHAQLFWTTKSELSFSADKHITFPIIGDDKFHEYEIRVGEHPKWKGQPIRALRFDPAVEKEAIGQTFEIDYLRGE